MDKSRSTQGTKTEDTVITLNKSGSISSTSFSNKSTKKEKHKERYISKYDASLFVMSLHGASVSGESPDKQRISCNNKRKNTLDTLIKVK